LEEALYIASIRPNTDERSLKMKPWTCAVVAALSITGSALADQYLDCRPLPGVGARKEAGRLYFSESGREWLLRDSGTRVRGELRRSATGFDILADGIAGGRVKVLVYRFDDRRCDSEGMGSARLLSREIGAADGGERPIRPLLEKAYACRCAVD
jgi:hypothetical protein